MTSKLRSLSIDLQEALNRPRKGRPSGPIKHETKEDLRKIILSLMDNDGPSKLTQEQKAIILKLKETKVKS